jgi:hypothetical protein
MSFDYDVKGIDYNTAMDVVIENHYLHRKSPCSHAYGLFKDDELVGVCVYGQGPSTTLRKGVCGPDFADKVLELTRLWTDDSLPRNSESYFVARTIKLLPKHWEVIVSFADRDGAGHQGYIYQALNFIYCGLSTKFTDPKVKGKEHLHWASYARGMTMAQVREKYGDENVYYVERPRKHRYVLFNAPKNRKRFLRKQLRYKEEPYPKA